MPITTAQQQQLLQLGVGTVNASLGGYIGDLAAALSAGATIPQIYESVANNPAFKALNFAFSDASTNGQFASYYATQLLSPALNSTQIAEVATLMEGLLDGGTSRGSLMYQAVTYLSSDAALADATYGTAAQQFVNKVTVATAYTIDQSGSATSISALQNTISTVTASASTVTNAIESNASSVGETFTLTSAADTGASFTGTAGNDTFIGQINADMGTGTTLNAGDALTGGAGTDTLSVTVAGASTAAVTSTATTLSAIEKVLVSNFDSNTDDAEDHEFNGALWTGVTTVGLSSSAATGDTSFTNLGNIVGATMANGAADLTVSYLSSVVSGTADTQTLALSGVTAGTFTASSGIETVAITAASSGSASTLTALSATGASKLTIDADVGVTISGTLDTNIKTIDASASTAAVSLVLGTADLTVTGGAGNDTIRIAGTTVDTNDTINAGDGTDTLQLTDAVGSATNGAQLAGFENLRIYENLTGNATGANAESVTVTQDVSLISGITSIGVSKMTYTDDDDTNADTGASTAAFTGVGATQTISISGITSAGDANDNGAMTAVVTVALKSDTTADSGTITLGTSTAAAAVAGANNTITLNVTASDYETLTLVNQGGSQTIATLTGADATTLVVNASKAFTVTTLTAASVAAIDASGSTANVSIGAVTAASSITGGSGNDSFTGGTGKDTIDGGAGNDTLTGGTGNDSITGGAGNDSIDGGGGNDSVYGGDGDDTFVDAAAGTEYVDGGAGNDTFNVVAVANLTSADTIVGGDGTDTLSFADAGDVDLTGDITALSNVSGVEVIAASGMNGGDTLKVNDGVVSAAGNSLALKFVTGVTGANTVDASGVLSTASAVSFTDLAGLATTYKIGNGKDNASMGDGADTVVVSNAAYLSSVDTLAGGSGSDTLSFTNDTAQTNTITTAQLTNITGMETFSINHATDTNLVKYVFTLNDTIVGAQVAVGGTFTITRDAAEDGTLKVDGSAVTSSYVLALSGEDGADTLIGGGGNDTITGTKGNDSLTGGAGNDDFVLGTSDLDTVTDLNIGTSSTSVDRLDIRQLGTGITTAVISKASTISGTTTNVLVLDEAAYQDSAAAETAAHAKAANMAAGASIVFWQDTLGLVHVSKDTNSQVDGSDMGTDMALLSGHTIADIAANLDSNDILGGLPSGGLSLTGTAGADVLVGGTGNDTISGGGGADVITGNAGDDSITIATLANALVVNVDGGAGNDTVTVTAAVTGDYDANTDILLGGSGTDTLTLNNVAGFTMGASPSAAKLGGFETITFASNQAYTFTFGAYEFTTDAAAVTVDATAASTITLTATALVTDSLIFKGSANADTVTASGQADTVTGGAGADTITLAGGADTLIFNSLVGTDTIADYVVADDSIQLSIATFTALGAIGALTADEFVAGVFTDGQDATDRIVYNTTTGALYYDADGNGGGVAVLIGSFTGTPVLAVGEFSIIA